MRGNYVVVGGGGGWSPRALLLRLGGAALGLWVSALLIPGIDIDDWQSLVAATAVLGIVNMVVRPIAAALSCCLILLTFGLFLVVINAAMLALTAWASGQLDLNFRIDTFWSALGGAIIISFATLLVTAATRPLRLGR